MTALMKFHHVVAVAATALGILAGVAQADELADIKAAGQIKSASFPTSRPFPPQVRT